MVSLSVKLLSCKCCKLLRLIDVICLISVIFNPELSRIPFFHLCKIFRCHTVKAEFTTFILADLHQFFQCSFDGFRLSYRVSISMSISFITKYKCIMKECIFHFILPGPEIYIRKCSLTASAWSLCKIIVNQFFVFQFRSFEFRYHPCTTPPSLQASLSDPLQSGCRLLHPDHHSECYPVYEVSA